MSGRHFSQPNPGPRGKAARNARAAGASADACAHATGRPNSGSRPAGSTTERTLEVRASRKKTTRREFLAASGAFVAIAALAGLSATRLLSNPGDPRFATFAQVQEPQPAPELREEQYRRVTLSAVGDHLMNMPVVEAADYNAGETGDGWFDFTPMYQGVADIVASHDLNFIDIETILGGDYLGLSGYPVFNSPSCIAEQVVGFGWNLCTTATNHCLDMGLEGIYNSCATWAQFPQMLMTGTFSSQEDRDLIRTCERQGITFAFLSYSDYFNGYVVPADAPWSVAEAGDEVMTSEVSRAKELADVVIVAMSWGSENDFSPNETQRHYAQLLANLGVDLILGFGPHVIQPIEWYQGYDEAGNPTGSQTLVVFSMGNFLSNQPYSYANVEGCFTCAFERLGTSGPVSLINPMWTPLINHISYGWHQVFKLKDYTYDLAASHESIGLESDPLGYCYNLTNQIIGPSGIPIDW